jgi:hypothetical protein
LQERNQFEAVKTVPFSEQAVESGKDPIHGVLRCVGT